MNFEVNYIISGVFTVKIRFGRLKVNLVTMVNEGSAIGSPYSVYLPAC